MNGTTIEGRIPSRTAPVGPIVILVGAVAFVIGTFLPIYHFSSLPVSISISLYRQAVQGIPGFRGVENVAQVVALYSGVGIIALLAVLGLTRRPSPPWLAVSILVAVGIWGPYLLAQLLTFRAIAHSMALGYWWLLAAMVIVVVGAIATALSQRRSNQDDEGGADAQPG